MARSTEQKRSRQQEQKTAKEINGRTTPASGSRWHQKGDIRSDKFLIECKTTTKDSYRLTAKTWEKIYKEALRDGLKEPVLRVDIRTLHGDTMSFAVMAGTHVLDYFATHLTGVDLKKVVASNGECRSFTISTRLILLCVNLILCGDTLKHQVTILPWNGFLTYAQSQSKEGVV